jgi:hypothetical protein
MKAHRHINNRVSRVSHDPRSVMRCKVGKHMERIIHVTFTQKTKVSVEYVHLKDYTNVPQLHTPTQDPNLRLEEVHHNGVQLRLLTKCRLVPPCKRGRGIRQHHLAARK